MTALKLLLPAMAALVLFAACGGDEGGDAGRTPGVGETLPPGQTPEREDIAFDIVAVEFAFEPNFLEVDAGSTARFYFRNEGVEDHTMAVYRDEGFTQPLEGATTGVEEGIQTYTFLATFDEPGTYYFRCEFHPTIMKGTIEAL